MIGKEVEKSSVAAVPEALEIMEERQKDGALAYEQQLAYDHAKSALSAKLSKEKLKAFKEELKEAGLDERMAVKVIDIMPINEDQLKNVLLMFKKEVNDAMLKKVMQAVEKYRAK